MRESERMTTFIMRLEMQAGFWRASLAEAGIMKISDKDLVIFALEQSAKQFPEQAKKLADLKKLIEDYKRAENFLYSYYQNDLVSLRDVIALSMDLGYGKEVTKEISRLMLDRNCDIIEHRFHFKAKQEKTEKES